MSDRASDLEQLRRRIDEIDDNLQDLLSERVQVVASVGAHKRSNSGVDVHQPAREAEILRRLAARSSDFPAPTLIRMWRELLAATVRQQGPFTIAVYVTPEAQGYWDLARDHYGSHTPMLSFTSTAQVIRAVTEGQASIGVLPIPEEEERDPWWRHLISSDENAPHVIARLPFGPRGNARADTGDALAIGRGVQVPTGQDRTLIAIENALDISRGRMFSLLSGIELDCLFMASCQHSDVANTLIELDGFIPVSDPRLQRFREQLGPALFRVLWFGGYAIPLPGPERAAGHAGHGDARGLPR
jgi:chorismate mutase